MRDRTPSSSVVSRRTGSSGVWFDPRRDGEGIVIEELGKPIGYGLASPTRGRGVLVSWYTYAPPGDPDPGPRWLIGIGFQTAQGVHVPSMTMTRGARFGSAFDPAEVERTDWGSLSLIIDHSRRMQVGYDGPPGWEGSVRDMVLLANVELEATMPASSIGLPQSESPNIVSASGTYFNPAREGEGIQVQLVPGASSATRRAIAVFYTYDTQGRQLWLSGVADGVSPQASEVNFQMTRTTGGVFGDSFNPAAVQRIPWGTLTLTIQSQPALPSSPAVSRVIALRWNALDPVFGSGSHALTRLTRVGAHDPRSF